LTDNRQLYSNRSEGEEYKISVSKYLERTRPKVFERRDRLDEKLNEVLQAFEHLIGPPRNDSCPYIVIQLY